MRSEDDERPRRIPKFPLRKKDQHLGKIPFPSREIAEKQVQNLMRKGRGFARVYECGKHFHLTSREEMID